MSGGLQTGDPIPYMRTLAKSIHAQDAGETMIKKILFQQGATVSDTPTDVITDAPNDDIQKTASEIHISMSDIIMNEIDGFASADYARYNPETKDEVVWSKEDIANYYGTDLTPAYISDGLFVSPRNDTTTVYTEPDGTVVEDTVMLSFYHAYYEDGSPKFTADVAACYGFSVTDSKI